MLDAIYGNLRHIEAMSNVREAEPSAILILNTPQTPPPPSPPLLNLLEAEPSNTLNLRDVVPSLALSVISSPVLCSNTDCEYPPRPPE